MAGWIPAYRQMLENPVVCKDSEHFAVWMYLLLNASHKEIPAMFGGNKITLLKGQLITGRKTIAEKFNIHESKVQRILKTFEIEQQIEQQNGNKNRLITVLNWHLYQVGEQQFEQQLNNNRTTTEQQLNTNNNVIIKELDNETSKDKDKNIVDADASTTRKRFIKPTLEQVQEYCFERGNRVDPENWFDHYTANGWKVGKAKNPMQDWKAAVRTWEKNGGTNNAPYRGGSGGANRVPSQAPQLTARETKIWRAPEGSKPLTESDYADLL